MEAKKGAYNVLINQSRAFGLVVVVIAQRPTEIDKTTFNQADLIHIWRIQGNDRKSLSKSIGIDDGALPDENLKFIQWEASKGLTIKKGNLQFVKKGNKTIPTFYNGERKMEIKL